MAELTKQQLPSQEVLVQVGDLVAPVTQVPAPTVATLQDMEVLQIPEATPSIKAMDLEPTIAEMNQFFSLQLPVEVLMQWLDQDLHWVY